MIINKKNQMRSYEYYYKVKNKYKKFPKLFRIWNYYCFKVNFDEILKDSDVLSEENQIMYDKYEKIWKKHSKDEFNYGVFFGMLSGFNKDDIESFMKGHGGSSLLFNINSFILKKRLPSDIPFPDNWILSPKTFKRIHKYLDSIGIKKLNEDKLLKDYLKYCKLDSKICKKFLIKKILYTFKNRHNSNIKPIHISNNF